MKCKSYKVLLLSNYPNNIKKSIEKAGDKVEVFNNRLDKDFIEKNQYDFIVSFGYRFLLDENVIKSVKRESFNLHIGFLPYNKGAHPNFWSNVESTPSGVTIHKIDKGLDTGDIIYQKEIPIKKEKHTFASSYKLLIFEIEKLFSLNWENLRADKYQFTKQNTKGTYHEKKDFEKYEKFLIDGWETNISFFLNSIKTIN